jgi:hypothetical protein
MFMEAPMAITSRRVTEAPKNVTAEAGLERASTEKRWLEENLEAL